MREVPWGWVVNVQVAGEVLRDDGDVVAGVEEEQGCLEACDAGAGQRSGLVSCHEVGF